ncbi:ABC transporter permease [Phaeovulum vinaykumarii]|uniref:Peptide/nickel transport system permease protein n=1 Tax=Phaeovulum vinaykumarii TaxID=407234 RepID=A0A1N7MMK9_9RHOB|nr:ABC transporter permease [Phaeovulum vinaykumarii]SIS87238.1 peptide/nickel transport system permease protein [Phaeovulum vinaykumarii]SOC13236.1 peptide/nickel transport system permease protein [Phaeovulum vinaykumarii]
MARIVIRRLAIFALSLWAASVIVFAAIEVVPGDPAALMLGLNATPETLAAARASLGLDQPPALRYLDWVGGFLRGDLGQSWTYKVPVADLVADRAAVSVPLAAIALGLSTALALPLGLIAAARRGRAADAAVMGVTQLGLAVPNFWFAMLLVLLFALHWRVLPAGGFPGWSDPATGLRALILPAVALALPQAAILARVLRSALIEVLAQEYIRTARAKGLSRGATLLRHALRNAALPVLTILGMQFSFLLAGTIIIENVFYLPGLGRLVFQAITQRDLIVVESVVMLLVVAVITVTFLTEIAYALADPRLRGRA